jgi:hexosaminidase
MSLLVLLLVGSAMLSGAQSSLTVIPALQEWFSASGAYQLTPQSRIVVEDPSLLRLANTFQQDLFDLSGLVLPVVTSTDHQVGDIALDLNSSVLPGLEESYSIEVGSAVVIKAATSSGVFYGTRTLLQLTRQSFSLPAGSGLDWPLYPERGFMLDVGEKFFPLDFLKKHVRDMSYLKMNYFHLHLSQDGGFRLESSSHPEAVSADHYTKAQIQELIDLAAQYYVTIVPEIDVPSHATAMLRNHPELQLPNHPEMLDLSKPGSYAFVKDLLEEYLPLFPAPYWHTGADEYLLNQDYALYPQYTAFAQQIYGPAANGQDLYVGFINWIDGIVKLHNKQLRAWNDLHGVTTVVNKPNKDIVLELFSANIGAANALHQGFKINNCSPTPLYYILGVSSLRADPVNLYENWAPNLQFVLNESVPPQSPGLLGAKLHVWCDFPDAETVDQVEKGIFAPLRSFAQNSWGSPKLFPSYNGGFSSAIDTIARVPGWDPDFAVLATASTVALPPGQGGTLNVLVRANSSFSGAITVTCGAATTGISCSVPVGQFVLAPTQQQNISIRIQNESRAIATERSKWLFFSAAGILVFVFVRYRLLWPAISTFMLVVLVAGCGYSRQTKSASPAVTVTVTSGSLSHSTTIEVTQPK